MSAACGGQPRRTRYPAEWRSYLVTLKQAMSYCDTEAVLFEWASEDVPGFPA